MAYKLISGLPYKRVACIRHLTVSNTDSLVKTQVFTASDCPVSASVNWVSFILFTQLMSASTCLDSFVHMPVKQGRLPLELQAGKSQTLARAGSGPLLDISPGLVPAEAALGA